MNPGYQHHMDKKSSIGQKAVEFIQDGDSIILDSGSTTIEVARNLVHDQQLKIITNALNIAVLLSCQPTFEIVVAGGEVQPSILALTGENTARFFQQFHVDKLFLGAAGVSRIAGLTYSRLNDLAVKRAMIEAAREVYLVADSTKIEKVSFASLGGLDSIHHFITDNGISDNDKALFEQHGIDLIIA